jgi:AAA15 family ATPase/GTPase
MKLKFIENYKSITEFNEVNFKDFTVLTGINGSGKSHLLEAIKNKKVVIEGYENSNKIVLFNYENFRLENEGRYTSQQIQQEKNNAWNWFNSNVKNVIKSHRNSYLKTNYEDLKKKSNEKSKSLFEVIKEENNPTFSNYINSIEQYIRNQQHATPLLSLY